jgi:hypothetical protein
MATPAIDRFNWLRVVCCFHALAGAIITCAAWYFATPRFDINQTMRALLLIGYAYMALGACGLLLFVHERSRVINVDSKLFRLLAYSGFALAVGTLFVRVALPEWITEQVVTWRHRWPVSILVLGNALASIGGTLVARMSWHDSWGPVVSVWRGFVRGVQHLITGTKDHGGQSHA